MYYFETKMQPMRDEEEDEDEFDEHDLEVDEDDESWVIDRN